MDSNFLRLYDEPLGLWHFVHSLLGSDWFSWLTGNTVYCGPDHQGKGQLMEQLWTLSALHVCLDEELSVIYLGYTVRMFTGSKNITNLSKVK